jgi:hypothetical protein
MFLASSTHSSTHEIHEAEASAYLDAATLAEGDISMVRVLAAYTSSTE